MAHKCVTQSDRLSTFERGVLLRERKIRQATAALAAVLIHVLLACLLVNGLINGPGLRTSPGQNAPSPVEAFVILKVRDPTTDGPPALSAPRLVMPELQLPDMTPIEVPAEPAVAAGLEPQPTSEGRTPEGRGQSQAGGASGAPPCPSVYDGEPNILSTRDLYGLVRYGKFLCHPKVFTRGGMGSAYRTPPL